VEVPSAVQKLSGSQDFCGHSWLTLSFDPVTFSLSSMVVIVWRSTLVSINEVNLRQTRLVLGWVTMSGFSSPCGTFILVCNQPPSSTHPCHPFVVGAISTSHRAVTPYDWGVKTGMVRVWVAGLGFVTLGLFHCA